MGRHWGRVAYVCVFLLAAVAVFSAWSQIGGAGHLDLIPWYWKLSLGLACSGSVVGVADAIASHERVVNRRSAMWLFALLLIAGAMGAVTYKAHLEEAIEEPAPEDESTAQSMLSDGRGIRAAPGAGALWNLIPAPADVRGTAG